MVAVDKNLGRSAVSNELGQIGADQVTALVQLSSIPLRAVASKVGHPFAHVAAGPVGRDTSARTDARLTAQILTYSRQRGVFAVHIRACRRSLRHANVASGSIIRPVAQ